MSRFFKDFYKKIDFPETEKPNILKSISENKEFFVTCVDEFYNKFLENAVYEFEDYLVIVKEVKNYEIDISIPTYYNCSDILKNKLKGEKFQIVKFGKI